MSEQTSHRLWRNLTTKCSIIVLNNWWVAVIVTNFFFTDSEFSKESAFKRGFIIYLENSTKELNLLWKYRSNNSCNRIIKSLIYRFPD